MGGPRCATPAGRSMTGPPSGPVGEPSPVRSPVGRRRVPGDDRGGVRAGGQRAVGEAALAAEPGGAERVGDRRGRVADEQRGLQREREALDQAPRAVLERVAVGEVVAQSGGERVEARVDAGGQGDLVEECSSAAGAARSARSTSSAMTLPEPSQIDPSGASRYSRGMPDAST
jgi:hypothetical protein